MPQVRFFQVAAPAAGLNQQVPPTMIEPSESPRLQNVRVRGGVLFKRPGYTVMASSIASGPMLVQPYRRLSGSTTTLLATCNNIYKWTGSAWSSIKSGLTGTMGGYHSACVMNDTWIYTNGVDHVQKWTGTGSAADLGGGTDYQTPAYHIARGVSVYSDRLHLYGTNEDGTALPYRVRWSELGKIEEFNEAQGGGYRDLSDDPSGVQGALTLGNYNIVYCGRSIWVENYIGGNYVYTFDAVVPNTGTFAPRSVVDLGNAHIFMGEDDIYIFNGSSATAIGGKIRDDLFKGVSRNNHIRCFGALNRDEHLYFLYVPHGESSGKITRAYIYDYQENKWTMDSAVNITCSAAVELGSSATIDDLPALPIDQMPAEPIDNLGGYSGRQFRVFADSIGNVYQGDDRYANDNGVAIDAYWDSSDFTLDAAYIHDYKRIIEVLYEATGNGVSLHYSVNSGDTWTLAGTQVLTNEYMRYSVPIDVRSRTFRLRFANNALSERFWLRWLGIKYTVSGVR